MRSEAVNVEDYLSSLPDDRRAAVSELRSTIVRNLPAGFKEVMSYGMIGYVVPHETYPPGYHCDPKLPLGFINLASQKNYIALYHMGLYSGELLEWFRAEWPRHSKKKLDMGKSCIRFKKPEDVPFELIGDLVSRITPERWVEIYESALRSRV